MSKPANSQRVADIECSKACSQQKREKVFEDFIMRQSMVEVRMTIVAETIGSSSSSNEISFPSSSLKARLLFVVLAFVSASFTIPPFYRLWQNVARLRDKQRDDNSALTLPPTPGTLIGYATASGAVYSQRRPVNAMFFVY